MNDPATITGDTPVTVSEAPLVVRWVDAAKADIGREEFKLVHDGTVDAGDTAFTDLLVWQDLNGNGVSEAGELQTLADLGIVGISVEETSVNETIDGQTVFAEGRFFYHDGGTGDYAGVQFTSPEVSGETGGGAPVGTRFDIMPDGVGPKIVEGFASGEDQLVFSATAAEGAVDAVNMPLLTFRSAAVGGDAQFIYDHTSSVLAWDADGTGGADAVDLAQFGAGTPLTADDFMLISRNVLPDVLPPGRRRADRCLLELAPARRSDPRMAERDQASGAGVAAGALRVMATARPP